MRGVLVGFAGLVPELLEFSSSGGTRGVPKATAAIDKDESDGIDDDGESDRGLVEDLPDALDPDGDEVPDFASDLLAGWGSAGETQGLCPTATS